MRIRMLPYLLPHAVLLFLLAGAWQDAVLRYQLVPFGLLVAIVLDVILGPGCALRPWITLDEETKNGKVWGVVLWAIVPLHVGVLIQAAALISRANEPLVMRLSLLSIAAFATATFGVTAAHELMHRSSRVDRGMALLLMASLGNVHFLWEHHAHHHLVGTPSDPATARRNETFAEYYHRSIVDGFRLVWSSEAERLRRSGSPLIGWRNRLALPALVSMTFYLLFYAAFGWFGVLVLLTCAVTALTTLQIINYLQHYGLTRSTTEAGAVESISGRHSWECCHPLSNWLLFDMPRHAEHHCDPDVPFAHDEAPHLPMGYFLAIWCVPFFPLWRRTIARALQSREEGEQSLHLLPFITHAEVAK